MEYEILSNCCGSEMSLDDSHCPGCRDGCGKVKLFEDGSEVDVEE